MEEGPGMHGILTFSSNLLRGKETVSPFQVSSGFLVMDRMKSFYVTVLNYVQQIKNCIFYFGSFLDYLYLTQ